MESELNYYTLRHELYKMGVPNHYFSLGRYGEEALCIVFEEEKWCIFEGERGNRYAVEFFDDEKTACKRFIERMNLLF